MKETINATSTFRAKDNKQLKKSVTDKVRKLINIRVRKAG